MKRSASSKQRASGLTVEIAPNFRIPANLGAAADASKMRLLLRRPAGAFDFTYRSTWLFDPAEGGDGVILQIPTGAHFFRLQRERDLSLAFLHAAPTTGTRVASIDLRTLERSADAKDLDTTGKQMVPNELAVYASALSLSRIEAHFRAAVDRVLYVAFSWSPEEAKLYVGRPGAALRGTTASPSDRRIAVHESGMLQEVGPGVIGVRVHIGGRAIFAPSANESWSDVKEAIRVLLTGPSADAMYQVIIGNQVIAMLNTGFESFAKTRFIELEREGWAGDFEALLAEFVPSKWRAQENARTKSEAQQAGRTAVWQFAESRHIDFGNYEDARRAYKAAFGMRFGVDLGLQNTDLEQVKRYIQYRQRIAHISPIVGFLNSPEFAKGEQPVFSGLAQAKGAVDLFDQFIAAFHIATLRIRLPS